MVAAAILSLGGHVALFESLSGAAKEAPKRQRRVEIAVLEKQVAPPPKPEPKPRPKLREPPEPKRVEAPPETPPAPNTEKPEPAAEKAPPVFGVTMSSVVGPGAGAGFRVRVGNTLMKDPEEDFTEPEAVEPLKPVPVHRLTKMPRKIGECEADYPPDAKAADIEGRVKLSIEILADGSVGVVRPLTALGHGLEDAAARALKVCHFAPAEVGGTAVATRIEFTYVFVIEG
jgi:protein TonB